MHQIRHISGKYDRAQFPCSISAWSVPMFDTVIGNPPYMHLRDADTMASDHFNNLYLSLMYQSVLMLDDGGEMELITPRDFMKATGSIRLNEFIYGQGTITELVELGDQQVFINASPNCVMFHFRKGCYDRRARIDHVQKTFSVINGQILFTDHEYPVSFQDLFYVKVGAVSGADHLYTSPNGNTQFVCSKTNKTGYLRRMFYNVEDQELMQHKEQLLQRSIRKFTDENWYEWGRGYYVSPKERIYVNAKTRNDHPFYYHSCKAYDGSVLAIFPRWDATPDQCRQIAYELNNIDWNELGFVCGGRFLFSQRSLENSLLPKMFEKYYACLDDHAGVGVSKTE
jgi:adenine-specific DNA-methyltransferase